MQYENANSDNRKTNNDMQWDAKLCNHVVACLSATNAISRSITESNKTINNNKNRLLLQKATNIINKMNDVTKMMNL